MKKFRDLGLSEETLGVLKKQGIVEPTEIQSKAIPFVLEGQDVIASSSTGSGKTLAFASALTEKIIPNGKIQSIILAPTRELAEQVTDAIRLFANKRFKLVSVYGGVPIENQINKIKKSDIVVGTPGRILDHLNRRSLSLKDVKILVLDEFDRMLDMGFQKDVDKIIKEVPKERQTLLFSATTAGVEYLLDKYTKNAIEITTKSYVDHSKLEQVYYDVPDGLKFSLLVHLLKEEKSNLVMVFCSTRRNADFVVTNLNNLGIQAKAIHGGLDQKKRIRTLGEFHKDTGLNIIVCTDVAARGLDIKNVTHVYNFDIPGEPSDYIHRIGRTARAGSEGKAINILASRDYEKFSDVINQKNIKIDEMELPYIKKVDIIKDIKKGRGRNNLRNDRRNNNGEPRRKEMYDAVCKKCGKKCQVPFKPTNGTGVSCSDCFIPKDSNRRGSPGRKSEQRGHYKRDDQRNRNNDRRRDSRKRGDSYSQKKSNRKRKY